MTGLGGGEGRRDRLLEKIRVSGFVSIPELRESLGVSESTIRRDLDALEESGSVRRTHGGVFFTGPSASLRLFEHRRTSRWDWKRAVAAAASRLIEDHDTELLDGGSTTYELARQLVGRPLQVVTNSLPVAQLFASSDSIDLVFLGGYVHPRTGVTLGPYTQQMLEGVNVQTAVISIAGANQRGYYNSNLLLVEAERAMMQCADRTMVVTDSSKFGRSSLARLCPLEAIHTVVVDSQLDLPWQQRLRDLGTQLFLAELEEPERSEEPIRESADDPAIVKTESNLTRRGGPSAGLATPCEPSP